MNPQNITLLVWDDPSNFNKPKTQMALGENKLYKLKHFYSKEEFELVLESIDNEALLVFCCHVNYENFESYLNFDNSLIREEYNISNKINYVSSGDSGEAMKKLCDEHNIKERIIKYYDLKQGIKADDIKPFTKRDILSSSIQPGNAHITSNIKHNHPQCDYVIITALEDDEMEKVLPMIKKEGVINDNKHLIEYGHLESNPEKKIGYASQLSTGMIDASILATKLILTFNPKFLIMPGVLGGKPEKTKIGDIVVSTKVFTIDKGKLTDEGFEKEIEASNTDNAFTTRFKREKASIMEYINNLDETRSSIPDIHFEPIACVRQVIDKEGYFVENISTNDRKTIALEMESYGIARACELINNGNTTPLIIKSVMDNTQDKADNAKTYAAWTSAMFLKYALEKELI